MGITLKDLAQICNCSVTSVSRALKDSDTISKELRIKVQSTAKELGYIPNLLASSMRKGYTKTIAMILQNLRNPFNSLLAKYVEEYASALGYSVIIMTTGEDKNKEYNCVIGAIQKGVDGILYLPTQIDTKSLEILKSNDFPFILYGRIFKDIESDYVIANDAQGAYIAVDHLIQKGHKNILFLNTFMNIYSASERYDGYKKALEDNNLPFIAQNVRNISMEIGETQKIVEQIFSHTNNYTAVFCFCDLMAFEVYYSLAQLGYRIPEDIAIASNDDIHNDIILPIKLTSSNVSRKRLAQASVDMLLDKISEKGTPAFKQYKHIVIDPTLTIGQTT